MAGVFALIQGLLQLSVSGAAETAMASAVFLSASYVAGYLCWYAGDFMFQDWSDRIIFKHLFDFVCGEKPVRERYLSLLRITGNSKLADFILARSVSHPDSVEEPALEKKCDSRTPEPDGAAEHFKDCGKRLRMLILDLAYAQNNPNFLGRVLSSWNNVKFVKGVSVSCFATAWLLLGKALSSHLTRPWGSPYFALWPTLCAIAVFCWRKPLRWRLRVYARDLVHALQPLPAGALSRHPPDD